MMMMIIIIFYRFINWWRLEYFDAGD